MKKSKYDIDSLVYSINKIISEYIDNNKSDPKKTLETIKLALAEVLTIRMAQEGILFGDNETALIKYCEKFHKIMTKGIRGNFRDIKKNIKKKRVKKRKGVKSLHECATEA